MKKENQNSISNWKNKNVIINNIDDTIHKNLFYEEGKNISIELNIENSPSSNINDSKLNIKTGSSLFKDFKNYFEERKQYYSKKI
jgi:hypothetical protein